MDLFNRTIQHGVIISTLNPLIVTAIDECELMKSRSFEFLDTANYQFGKEFYTVAAFSFHQALEHFVKSKLLQRGVAYPHTHSLKTLLEIMTEVSDDKCSELTRTVLDKYILEIALLEDAYITSGYVSRTFSKGEVIKLQKVTEEVLGTLGINC